MRHLPLAAASRAAVCFCAAALAATAVETRFWTQNEQADFEKGKLTKLSLRSDGRLMLAPEFREVFDSGITYLWSLAADSKGNLYAGGGGPSATTAKLFRVDAQGKGSAVAELPGMEIHAIAVNGNDRVFAATNPDGKVYRVENGRAEVFYDPKAKYIWGLAFNSRGDLFVATGDAGEVHRVTSDGKGAVFYKTEETHARSIAVDAADNVIVGTEPGGLVIRIGPKGEGFVLYQAPRREITAVGVARDGMIYAAGVGTRGTTGGPLPPTLSLPVQPVPSPTPGGAPAPAAPKPAPATITPLPPPPGREAAVTGGSELYRIEKDGYVRRVWSHAQDLVYAIGFDSLGRAVLGTGNKGNVYRVDTESTSTLLVNAQPTQITAIAAAPRGGIFAASGNIGRVFQIGPGLESQGSFESEAFDAASFSNWGRIAWLGESAGGKVAFDTRSGNLDRPQNNWSPWVPAGTDARVVSPAARFLQYRVTLAAGSEGRTPDVSEVQIAWMAKNVAPAVDQIEATPPNYRFPAASISVTPTQNITLPPLGQRKRTTPSLSLDAGSATMQYAKGWIGARWAATDPNNDDLLYKIEIRGVGESEWKLLRDKVRERNVAWESTAYPDGEYQLRVTASDMPDNPPDQALTAQLSGNTFLIDNTPPMIQGLAATRSGKQLTLRWSAKDARSILSRAEYSLNGGEWIQVQPTTGLSDAMAHAYSVTIDDAAAGENTIAVRVTDDFDNQSVDKTLVR